MSELQLKLLIRVALFVFLLPLASADCVELDLGMENRKIPDDEITASSQLSAITPAKNGRLNHKSGSSWCAGTSDTNPYLQIDLQTHHIICAVSTQGNSQADQWVQNYTIQFSSDGATWTGYKEGGKIKTFQGNNDKSSEVKHVLYESTGVRHLRILPNAYNGARCIRMEVFGIKRKPVNVALGKATLQSSTFNNTQLRVSGVSGNAVDGNSDTEFRNGSCAHTQPNNPSWWRVDLGSDKVAVSDIFIVNRVSARADVMARNKNYSITLGDNSLVANNPQCRGLYSFVNFTASAVCFTNPLTTGRYVGILTEKEQILQLCEVEIYLRDNLAFGKQTDQSSVAHAGASSRAVDGNSNPDYYRHSCTHTGRDNNPWWRVDLGQVEPVSEIYLVNQENYPWFERQNNFEIRVGMLADNGGIINPRCGDKQSYSLPKGKGASFFCRPILFGRYVTVRSLKGLEHLTLCEVEVYSERRACQMQAIGVASTDTLPDASFSASSERSGFEASKGRLNANAGWLPRSNDQPDDYMQVDLQYEFLICAVASQGRLTYDDWTTEYKLQLSFDGSTFVTYKENNVDKIFSGNSGRHDIVKHNLENVRARFIRFQPVKFARSKALRVEVYGVLISRVPSQAPSNLTLSARSSTSITASWQLPPAYSRHGIITGFKLFYKKRGLMGSMSAETINGGTTFSGDVTGLDKYTEYEFQVLAFTSHGDGPKSSVLVERTMEDVPSRPPSGLTVAASTFNSVLAFWQLPPEDFRHGIITGYKLFYGESGGDTSSTIELLISDAANRSISVTGLQTSTDYDFQVLAFTSVGDGPKSSVEVVRTFLGVPDRPPSFNHTLKTPTESQGPMITLSWTSPSLSNGVIRKYSVFYHHSEDPHNIHHETVGPDVFSYTIEVLGGVTYWFEVRAEIIQPGVKASLTVDIPEYKPSGGPANVLSAEVNKTTLNISWAPLPREQSNGDVILYNVKEELLSRGIRQKRSPLSSKTVNTSNTFIILRGLLLCSQYQVSVRAYTKVGPGPYGPPVELPRTSGPESPTGLIATNVGASQVTLEWKEPELMTKDGLSYRVKYLGTKSYNESFREEGFQEVGRYTSYTMKGLAPGSIYEFQIIVSSLCGLGKPKGFPYTVKTKITAPVSPAVLSVANKRISTTTVTILLWPAEQRNGPISFYQVIVLNVVDGVEDLPSDYASKLKDSNIAEIGNLTFYVAAEIESVQGNKKSWEFIIGDGKTYGAYKNKELHIGEDYIVYQRAMTNDNGVILDGPVSKVAKISVTEGVGVGKKEGSESVSIAQIAVPVVLVIVLVPLLLFAILLYRRRRQAEKSSQEVNSNKVHVPLGELRTGSVESSGSTADLVYQNVSEIPSHENVGVKASFLEEKESVYSEADDGKPKAIPVAEFAQYLKNKSDNGAIVLKEEFKKLPSISPHSWDVGKSNKMKNRFGNITTYDHSRVVLEKIEGDPKSDYINASYIPTFDEESMNYIATQGPTSTTISDFWRMIWQKNCSVIVMLTNLVELGKNKCNQYWPDSATRFGSITVTLLNTQNFADYCIRTLKLVKGTKTREVHQYHFTSWPDRGVPHHSTALLGFRWKVHARNQTTGGPLVVHCSAGVGRTGTYIAIDAMLEGAKKKNTVFIQNYVKVMREHRPYMVQKDTQYVFIHQAVMEALTCGTTEVASQDLRIRMNKLARVMSDVKHTGYAEEFKRLELVSSCQSSGEEFTEGLKPSNFNKNRFSNILPMDSARVLLRSSEPNEDYINASFVDDYSRRNAYILTQAPLNNTINDFWRMISQYDIGTIVMLHSLKEEKESYPQYWPSEGSAKYGDITLQLLSEKTAKNITTSKLSVTNAMPPRKTSTVQHIQFTGWANRDSNPDPREILDLLTVIEQSQQQSGDGVIVFQCSDGVGRSGCVATIMSVIERVKIEQTVDVFQTIKLIRAKRPGAVNTLDLYSFCYKTILAYLDSFNCYSNFADC